MSKETSMKRILTALIALSVLTGSIAVADSDRNGRHGRRDSYDRNWNDRHSDGHRRDYDRRHSDGHRRDHDRGDHGRRDFRRDDRRHDHRHYDRHPRFDGGRYHRPHGYVHRSWRRGARLPVAYHAPRYVVHDYNAYRLRPPPRGYHWVRVDQDVILAAIAGGVVADVVTGFFYAS
jgi:Ni/Co efflux regulator RcnB